MLRSALHPLALAAAIAFLPALAQADVYTVQVTGTVDLSSGTATNMASLVPLGSTVTMSFTVDSNNTLASTVAPTTTRGYLVDPGSFKIIANGLNVGVSLSSPMYFSLRNNDPRVDGVFLSTDANYDRAFTTTVPGFLAGGQPANLSFNYHQTWTGGNQFSSLNIADAVGSYGTQNISVYQMDFELPGGFIALEVNVPTLTIAAAVPEPGEWALLAAGLGPVGFAARRRRAAC